MAGYPFHGTDESILMKHLLFVCLFLPALAGAQQLAMVPAPAIDTSFFRYKVAPKGRAYLHGCIIASNLAAGIAQGLNETAENNKWGIRDRWPRWDESWWNPDSSWRRANGRNWLGREFPIFSDMWHLNNAVGTFNTYSTVVLCTVLTVDDLRRGKRHRWKSVLRRSVIYSAEATASRLLAKRATLEYFRLK